MSEVTTPAVPAAAATEQVLGSTAPEVAAAVETPVVAAPVVAAPNANGTAPAVGQTAADAKAKADADKAEKETAARKQLDDAQAKKDTEIAAKHAADKAWGEFKFKAPEGVVLDDKQLKTFSDLARAEGLKPEQAQKFIDFQGQALKAQQSAANLHLQESRGRELAQLKSDPMLGGDKWDASLRTANKAIDKFGSPELKRYLGATGQDANPHLFRIFHAIGKAMSDDKVADGAALGGRGAAAANPFGVLYPSMQKR